MSTDAKNDDFWRTERAAAQLFPDWHTYHPAYKAALRTKLLALTTSETSPPTEQLTDKERKLHDDGFMAIFEHAMGNNVPLNDGEECIAAGVAVAAWIIASRNT
jgi:hypothetical protein